MRIGHGYDIHRLEAGRELWLGGIRIDWPRGLLGHSDADCVLHALADALFGALALPDIGEHFPDTEPAWRGARSSKLLEAAVAEILSLGYRIVNADVTIVAEEPRLRDHKPLMRQAIAEILRVPPSAVGIKARTREGLDAVGERRAIEVHAVVLVEAVEGAGPESLSVR